MEGEVLRCLVRVLLEHGWRRTTSVSRFPSTLRRGVLSGRAMRHVPTTGGRRTYGRLSLIIIVILVHLSSTWTVFRRLESSSVYRTSSAGGARREEVAEVPRRRRPWEGDWG